MELSIVYDNYVYDKSFRPGSGFACLIKTGKNTVLFDTGAHISILLYNLNKLGVAPKEIDRIALSHLDSDHTGGLFGLLEKTENPTVYVPAIFPGQYKRRISYFNAQVKEVSSSQEICDRVISTGGIGRGIVEQGLILTSNHGAVVVIGCGHPSVRKIVEAAQAVIKGKIDMIAGGFDMEGFSEPELREAALFLKETGIKRVAPSHCSGDTAIEYLRREFGDGFVESGVGRTILV
ncbi:MAG: MBL fold metallo-hydrolase [Dehalococcoidia bacterium]|nr:MBL fold metallo-hydrolase [Dehalococcoidia bacterium]MDZ4245565.1 MBL fold metallo-hydrolase [Dehalococcoidia bacterium]